MSILQKTPMYVYDEPATYDDFTGGINSDPANENLRINELRDALNVHYDNGILRNRFGASKHLDIVCDEDLVNVQGVFLFTSVNPYLIIAANGKLYSGLYQPKGRVKLKQLKITTEVVTQDIFNQVIDLPIYELPMDDLDHNGYIYKYVGEQNALIHELVFQNRRDIEAIPYSNTLYIATGTKIVEVKIVSNMLHAQILQPFIPSGIEYQQIGPNILSPFPDLCIRKETLGVKTAIHGILPIKQNDGKYRLQTIMSYESGKTANDYLFKWEKLTSAGSVPLMLYDDWNYKLIFNSALRSNGMSLTQGLTSLVLTEEEIANVRFRVTFAEVFERDAITHEKILSPISIPKTVVRETEYTEYSDFVVDKVAGGWFGSGTSILLSSALTEYNNEWKQLQSCVKITGDGNKFLLYDDLYNSGKWWKTVIGNPAYVTYRNSLNFKTTNDEALTKVINFKGIIVAFSYNKFLGGNISIVTGNGDDYPDEGYSPYARRVANKFVTTDNPASVQIAENMILFKYKQYVYMIEGSELTSEIISVQSVNDQLIYKSNYVDIPWEDNDCVSEITDGYYSLIWKEKISYSNGNIVLQRKPMRVKMYYKLGGLEENRVVFPWLRDEADTFNAHHILYIEGQPYHLYDNLLIGYHEKYFNDLNSSYTSLLRLRGYDMNYPKFIKSLKKLILYYHRGQRTGIDIDVEVYNEANYLILDPVETNDRQDLSVLYADMAKTNELRVDPTEIDIKVLSAQRRFSSMLAFVVVKVTNGNDFSLGSITFLYKTLGLPKATPYEKYKKVIRKGDAMTLTKEDLIIKNKGDK